MSKYLRQLLVAAVLVFDSLKAQPGVRVTPVAVRGERVTSVAGESWLEHLHRSFNETSMGKTDHLGPRAPAPGEEQEASSGKLGLSPDFPAQDVVVRGSDLYRLNCQGCHRESGLGAPPEIGSIIGPVRATSASLVWERMRNMGMEVSRAGATELASQSERALWARLHDGGQDMPGFAHLSTAEIQSLMAYLRELAGVPGAERNQRILREAPVRVGELIVKSTCHICHNATGPNPSSEQLEKGAIPPLATLTRRVNFDSFIRKVTIGAPLVSSDSPMRRRGRMPVFYYLNQNEAADAYLYLTLYPPSESALASQGPLLAARPATVAGAAVLSSPSASGTSSHLNKDSFAQKQTDDWIPQWLMLAAVWLTVHLLAAGIALTLGEFRRLSERSKQVRTAVPAICGDSDKPRPQLSGREPATEQKEKVRPMSSTA